MATYLFDDLVGTVNAALSAHAPNSGPAWTRMTNYAAGNENLLTGTGKIMRGGLGGTDKTATDITVADYQVDAVIDFDSLLASDNVLIGARQSGPIMDNLYIAIFQHPAGTVQIQKLVSGTPTTLCTSTALSYAAGQQHTLSLRVVGTSVTALWDGVPITPASGSNPVTDATFSAAGAACVRVGSSGTSTQTATTGLHVSAITVADPVPTNTVAPAISGTRVVGQTLTTTNGTWSNAPTSYAYRWQRDSGSGFADISGATSSTYVLQNADVGFPVRCMVTASNASGAGTPAPSNTLVVVAEMLGTDVTWNLAAGGGIGGSPAGVIAAPTDVYDPVTFGEATAGDTEYRVVYLKNTHAVRSLTSTVVWIDTQTSSPTTDIAIGVAPEAAGSDVTPVADEQTPPVGVTFLAPADKPSGVSLGTLGPGQARGVWLRWRVLPNTTELASDACTLAWDGTPA